MVILLLRPRPGLGHAYSSGSIELGLEWTEVDSRRPENAGSVDMEAAVSSIVQLSVLAVFGEKCLVQGSADSWIPLTRAPRGSRGDRVPRRGWPGDAVSS